MGRKPGLPAIYLPTGSTVYWCRFTVAGKRHRLSTGERDPEAADEAAKVLAAEAALGRKHKPTKVETRNRTSTSPLEVLFTAFIEWAEANGRAKSYTVKFEDHFYAHFRDRWQRIGQIDEMAIERYKLERAQDAGSRTIYKELVTLSQFLKWAERFGHGSYFRFERVQQVSDYQPPNLAPEDVRRLLMELPTRATHRHGHPVREFFTVQWAQAFRPGELESLRWCDVNFRKREVTIRQSQDKAREGRTIAMAKEAFEILNEMYSKTVPLGTALIFGEHNYRASLYSAAERLKMDRVTRHNLRHFRLSELAENTTDVGALQFFAGHKHLATTDRYVRSRTARTAAMLDAMPSILPKKKTRKKS